MQDFLRRHFWVVHLLALGVSSALAAGLAGEVAAVVLLKPSAPAAPKAETGAASRPVKPDPAPSLLSILGDRNLFDGEPPEPVVEEEGEEQPGAGQGLEGLNVDLLATLVAVPREWSLATIRVDGTSRLVRIGVLVADRAEVVEIAPRYIVLQEGENRKVVRLWDPKGADKPAPRPVASAGPGTPAPSTPAPGSDFSKGVKKTGANEYQVDRGMLEENLQDLSKLGMQARIVPNYEGGRYAGFRLVGVRPDSLYRAIGLESGDLIRRVNGSEIDTPNKAIELFEQLRSSSNIALDIERRGQKVTLTYQIK
ncbi:hypothetical protein KBD49_02575 [Myxococcota bacterium]|jgi:general secretion pathway protein C|nr:hypothetical protein [Myxococcota bacterium]